MYIFIICIYVYTYNKFLYVYFICIYVYTYNKYTHTHTHARAYVCIYFTLHYITYVSM